MSKKKRDPEIVRLLKCRGHFCYLCGEEFTKSNPATRDHIIPRADGGSRHSLKNIKLAHAKCNRERDRSPVTLFKMGIMFLREYPYAKTSHKVIQRFVRDGVVQTKQKYWAD